MSYLFIKEKPQNMVSVVQVSEENNVLRIKNGGFETPKGKYYNKEKDLKKSILEGRPGALLLLIPLIGQLEGNSHD